MWQSYIYGMHWEHDGRRYYDEIPAESQEAAVEYFLDHKRDDVTFIRAVYIGPNEGGVREPKSSPYSPAPFHPLMARRKPGLDEDAR